MARIVLGGFINDIRGSVGGFVFDNYSGVHIVRSKPSFTTNPQSPAQSNVRAAMQAFVTKWKSLTQAEHDAWEQMRSEFPAGGESDAKLSRGGLITVPRGPFTAWNAFLACNMNRYLSGYSLLTDILIAPPIGFSKPEPLKTVSATAGIGEVTFCWEYITPGPRNERLEVWIKSVDAEVHPQLIYTEARNADGCTVITSVRGKGGIPLTPTPGTYRLQAMVVSQYGLTSQPSELVSARIETAELGLWGDQLWDSYCWG